MTDICDKDRIAPLILKKNKTFMITEHLIKSNPSLEKI